MATFVLLHGMWHGGWCWKKVTPLALTNPAAAAIPRTYISCSEEARAVDLTAEETKFNNLGWAYRHLPTGHAAMITMPEALVNTFLDLI